jgi:putative hydrolase of the HAD superfamily
MQLSSSKITNQKSIKNIIFDFGNVICDIDVKRTEMKFINLGLKTFYPDYDVSKSKTLFEALETGSVTSREFRDELKKFFVQPVTDDQIDDAWNAMLFDIPEPRIRLLEKLRKHFRIFLLSNTNEIHYRKYLGNFKQQYGYPDLEALFEKIYLSYRIGLKKPSIEIFQYVLQDSGLNPSESLFIDDSLIHVEGARTAGIHAHHLQISQKEDILDLFMPE